MKKNKMLPNELLKIVQEVQYKQREEDVKEARLLVELYRTERANSKEYWDYKLNDEVTFFDRYKSYELTGYRPINETLGLDFNPSWFTEAREIFHKTGHYCSYLPGSKRYQEFWRELYRRCRDGYTFNGYTITGDHYFFLNFYQLPITHSATKAGAGRLIDFPDFYVALYEFFHYYELAKRLRKHAALMKARGVGQERPTINSAKSVNTKVVFYIMNKQEQIKFDHYVNTEVTLLIAEYRNALGMNVNDSNNSPKSVEHSLLDENVR